MRHIGLAQQEVRHSVNSMKAVRSELAYASGTESMGSRNESFHYRCGPKLPKRDFSQWAIRTVDVDFGKNRCSFEWFAGGV